ncbi:MAG TPA: hypothetical protein VF638_00760 [Sphingomonas sp.]|jgi:hypothetical protein
MSGRPSTYDPSYCDRVIELGNIGASVVEMAHDIGVSRKTLERNWPEVYPEFADALEYAREASQVWWERKGRDSLEKIGFQASVWSRSMGARFPKDWRETKASEISGPNGEAIPIAEVRRTIVDPATNA